MGNQLYKGTCKSSENRVTVINRFDVVTWNAEAKSTLFLEIVKCIIATNLFLQQTQNMFFIIYYKLPLWLNDLFHTSQWHGHSWLWKRRCFIIQPRWLNNWTHTSHWYDQSPLWMQSYFLRFRFAMKNLLHITLILMLPIMYLLISLQTEGESEWLITNITVIWTLFTMDVQMYLHTRLKNEWLIAHITVVQMLSTMDVQMFLQFRLTNEWLIAHITVVQTLSMMDALMCLKITLKSKSLTAHITRVWTLQTKDLLMLLQTMLSMEWRIMYITMKRKVNIVCVWMVLWKEWGKINTQNKGFKKNVLKK